MPKLSRALTANELKKLAKVVGEYAVGGDGCAGLFLRVQQSTECKSAAYVLRRRTKTITVKKAFGMFEEMTAEQARAKAREWNALIAAGIDPREKEKAEIEREQRAAAIQEREALTIGELLPEFFDYRVQQGQLKNGEKYAPIELRRIQNNVPGLLEKSAVLCTSKDVAEALKLIWCTRPETANKVVFNLQPFFRWLMTVRELRPKGINPASLEELRALLPAERKRKKRKHMNALAPDQMPAFMKALHARGEIAARCLEFAILTCLRSDNVRTLKWEQFDADRTLLTLTAEQMKCEENGQHIVPLSPQAQELLRSVEAAIFGSEYVFPSPFGDKPLSSTSLCSVIQRMDQAEVSAGREGWIDRKQTAIARKNGDSAARMVATQHGTSRATFETWAAARREDARAIALCQHHKLNNPLEDAYDRDESIPLKRELLERWAAFCYSEISEEPRVQGKNFSQTPHF